MSAERPAILLIGGPGPIGLAVVEALARTQAFIVLSGRPTSALDLAARRLQRRGHTVEILPYDAAWSAAQTAEMLGAAEQAAGSLDAVVVAVGAVNAALVADEAAELLGRRGQGGLLLITSTTGHRRTGAALDAFVLDLDRLSRPLGVRCFVVHPRQVRARMLIGLPAVPLRLARQSS